MIFAQQFLPHSNWEFFGLLVLVLGQYVPGILTYLASMRNHDAIKQVGVQVDGKMEQLLSVSKTADQAEGRQQERHHNEALAVDAAISGKAIIEAAEARALAVLEAAEAKARELLKVDTVVPDPEGETTVRKVRPS